MSPDLIALLELCSKYDLGVKIWPNGEEVSLYFEFGVFEHPREAIEFVKETLGQIGLDSDDEDDPHSTP